MAERPILFSGPMVRAILEGRKTQTRRILKPPPWATITDTIIAIRAGLPALGLMRDGRPVKRVSLTPYGVPGDRLWVRETWAEAEGAVYYRATDRELDAEERAEGMVWRPSIHMPRRVSRIDLEIVSVRVERLQNLSRDDARAEGVESLDRYHNHLEFLSSVGGGTGDAEIEVFRSLWNEINGARATWESNPWVWVVEFKRVQP